jgi:hypothetical protein
MESNAPITDHLVILLYDHHMHDITHIQDTNDNVSQHHIVLVNPFQPSDAMCHHTFHLSLICMSFAH